MYHDLNDELDRLNVKLAVTALFTITLVFSLMGHEVAANVSAAATNLLWIWR